MNHSKETKAQAAKRLRIEKANAEAEKQAALEGLILRVLTGLARATPEIPAKTLQRLAHLAKQAAEARAYEETRVAKEKQRAIAKRPTEDMLKTYETWRRISVDGGTSEEHRRVAVENIARFNSFFPWAGGKEPCEGIFVSCVRGENEPQ